MDFHVHADTMNNKYSFFTPPCQKQHCKSYTSLNPDLNAQSCTHMALLCEIIFKYFLCRIAALFLLTDLLSVLTGSSHTATWCG